jgi:hypothetical protein
MSEIKKPVEIEDKLQSISNKVNAETLPKITSAYNAGRANDFSAKQANLAKYASYGSETFGKLGFDPYKSSNTAGKSGMDELYDTQTSWTSDIGRAFTGMQKLAGIGIQDTFALGAFADQGNYLTFEDTMNKYSSTRGGVTGFVANTMTSAGYTVGIIAGIAAEEMALAGITALSGGTAAPGTIAAGGTLLARGVGKLKEAGSMLKAVNKLQDLNTAKSFMGATGKFVGGSLKSFGKALNPLENTYDFLKTIDKLEDFNGLRQTAIGAGAIVRDARKITMAHSESKLEADLAAKEFKQQMFDDYYLDKANIGTVIPDSYLDKIESEGQKVKDRVYSSNFGLIYATNAITFDNMFKNMKGTNRWAGIANDAYRVSRKEGTKVAVDALAKTFGNAVRKKLSTITLKSAMNSALSSSMEGVQELGQDMISESMKSYHARNVKGTQVRGGMLEYLHNDLSKAASKQYSEEGAITFLSGALMGVFASPAGFAVGQVNNFVAGGGAQKTYQRVFDNKKWQAEKTSLEIKRKEKTKVLTEFFNNSKNFIDGFSKPIYTQNELQETMLQAAENKNDMQFKNGQHDSFVTGVHTLLEAGLENEFAEHLEYMAKNFGAQELNEVFGRTDITEETKAKYQEKLQEQANNVKKLRAKYNEIQETVINPHNMKGVKTTDPDYLEKFIKYRAVENLKKELLFSDSKIADRANRIKALEKDINESNPLSSLEINALLNSDALEQQIGLLQAEVEANKTLTLTGAGKESANKAQAKLDAFKVYQEKLKAFTTEQQKAEGSIYESDAYEDLFEAYNNLMQTFGKNTLSNQDAQVQANKKQFDKVFDYISLGEENKIYQEFVDTLLNPSGASAYLKGQEDLLKRLDDNKAEHIENALKAFEEKSTADDMLNALYAEGLFFDLNELDDLIKNRMMPSQIYDIADNNKEATPEQVKIAQQIINKFIVRLTGKSIVNDKTTLNKQGRKLKSDKRTVAGILRQYGITLNKEIKLSSKAGQRFLDKLMAKENKYLTRLDREILAKLGDQDVTIKFITDGTLPVQMDEKGVLLMDLRFAGRDYTNSVMSIENMIVTGLTQNKIAEELRNNDNLWLAARNAMEQAKSAFQATFPAQNIDEVEIFDDPVLFLTEAMNDIQFQKFLAQIEDNIQPASKSLWSTLMTGIKEIVSEEFDKRLINRVINISAKALDSKIVDNIAEEETDTKVTEAEKTEARAEKFDELTSLAKELALRWNVNVKILNSQKEAEDILNKIQNPFFQKFNTILGDLLYGPTGPGIINLTKGVADVALSDLLKSVYEKSESLSELIQNLKELSVYQTNGKVGEMVNWLIDNADNIGDGIEIVKNIFFQAEGQTTAGFYDEKTNTAYIVADAVKANTLYHEMFLHPFLINLEKTNPAFYKRLVDEAKQNAEAVAYVEANYGPVDQIGVRQYEHELVGRVYDQFVNNELNQAENQGLLKTLGQFIKRMFASVAEYFGIAKTDIKRFNEKKTTIADLAKVSVREKSKVDLGAIIEADAVVSGVTSDKTTSSKRDKVIPDEVTDTEEVEEPVTREEKEVLNDAKNIQSRIATIEKELDVLNKQLADNSLSFVQKRSTRTKITQLSIELNELYDKLNDIQPELDAIKAAEVVEDLDAEYIPKLDYNDNEIITHQTPWPSVPKDLREALAIVYGKPLTKLNNEDVAEIRKEMKSNPKYIKVINDFSENRLREQDLVKGQQELAENQKRVEANKAARQQQIAEQREADRQRKKQKVKIQAPVSDENFLKNLLPDFDYSILTEKEIKMLVKKFKDNSDIVPFTVNDIISFVVNKQAKEDAKKQRKQLLDDIDKQRAQRLIDQQIESNFNLLATRKLSIKQGKKLLTLRITPGMFRFITTYHPEIFKEDKSSFIESVYLILQTRKNEKAKLKLNPIEFKPKGINFQLTAMVNKLEKEKHLYPEVVYQINLALYKAGSNLRVRAIRKGKPAALSTMYTIGKKYANEKRSVLKAKPSVYSGKKRAILEVNEGMLSPKMMMQVYLLQQFILGAKISKEAVLNALGSNNITEADNWVGITEDEADRARRTGDSSSIDLLADFTSERGDLFERTNDVADALQEFLRNYDNIADAVEKIYDDIQKAKKTFAEESFDDASEDVQNELMFLQDLQIAGMTRDEAVDNLNVLKYLNTPEGQEMLDKEAAALAAYYDSVQAEIINDTFEGNPEELSDEDGELYNSSQKDYDPEDAEAANDMANQEDEFFAEFGQDPNADFFEGIEKVEKEETQIDKELQIIYDNGRQALNGFKYIGTLQDALNQSKRGDLNFAIAVYKYKPSAASKILEAQFRTGVFTDKNIVVNGKAYRVAGYQQNMIYLQDLVSLDQIKIGLDDLMNGVTEVLEPGSKFNATNIDSVVNVAEFDYIKGAYDEILNNFTSFMGEANALSEEDLMADLNKEITKCK